MKRFAELYYSLLHPYFSLSLVLHQLAMTRFHLHSHRPITTSAYTALLTSIFVSPNAHLTIHVYLIRHKESKRQN